MNKPYKKANPLDKLIPKDLTSGINITQPEIKVEENKVSAPNWKEKSQAIQENIKKDVAEGKPFINAVKDNATPAEIVAIAESTIKIRKKTGPPKGRPKIPGSGRKPGAIDGKKRVRLAAEQTVKNLMNASTPEEAAARWNSLFEDTMDVLTDVGLKNKDEAIRLNIAKFLMPYFAAVKVDPNALKSNETQQQPGNQFAIIIQQAGEAPPKELMDKSKAINIIKEDNG